MARRNPVEIAFVIRYSGDDAGEPTPESYRPAPHRHRQRAVRTKPLGKVGRIGDEGLPGPLAAREERREHLPAASVDSGQDRGLGITLEDALGQGVQRADAD